MEGASSEPLGPVSSPAGFLLLSSVLDGRTAVFPDPRTLHYFGTDDSGIPSVRFRNHCAAASFEPSVLVQITVSTMLWLAPIVLLLVTSSTCNAGMGGRKLLDPSTDDAPPAYSTGHTEPSTVDLGKAEGFTVLAFTTVTNTGPTTVGGCLGVCDVDQVVPGEGQITYSDSCRAAKDVAVAAMDDVKDAYNEAANHTDDAVIIDVVNIGGVTFTPGLYKTTGALEVSSGTLYLSGKGVYIFQMDTTLLMSTGRQMVLSGGAEASDIFWVVGSSATFEVNSVVMGTVMAHQAISVNTGATVTGRLFAINAAVTMQSNTVAFPVVSGGRRRQLQSVYSEDAISPVMPVKLLTAEEFTVIAYATITNTGLTNVGGLIGVNPGSAVTGETEISFFPEPLPYGRVTTDGAKIPKADAQTAYDDAKGRVDNVVGVNIVNIGGLTFWPGLYKSTGALEVSSGDLVFDADGDESGVFIFQMETTFSVSSHIKMHLVNKAKACNVFWQMGSSANFASYSEVVGTFMAYAKIDVWSGAKIEGRLFSLTEAVNLQANDVVFPSCSTDDAT
eukprot:gene24039-biopygen18539